MCRGTGSTDSTTGTGPARVPSHDYAFPRAVPGKAHADRPAPGDPGPGASPGGRVHPAKNFCAARTPSTSASTSAGVL
ncbi:hypothetical protein Shyhy01_50750 [Streptomyces hygroscopicus subsp. hygroscopicus]|nr:hypothetical protein Shyhy01_50750 [Streptomyces hygroscopicus subsp. hygroscopicus]